MTSLAVIDPVSLMRASLAAMVSLMGFDPVWQAAELRGLAQDDAKPRPDLILISLPETPADIAPRIGEIRAWAPDAKVVFLAAALDPAALCAGFAAGGYGYLVKTISSEGLKHSLFLVGAGEKVFPSELVNVLSVLTWQISSSDAARRELQALHATERELEVLRCLAKGESNSRIATRLGVSQPVIVAELRHIFRMLRVTNRTQAALWAVANGLAVPLGATEPTSDGWRGAQGQVRPAA